MTNTKWIHAVAVAMLALGLAACQKPKQVQPEATAPAPTTDTSGAQTSGIGADASAAAAAGTMSDAQRQALAALQAKNVVYFDYDSSEIRPEYDAVVSCVGAMFAPPHQTVADEILRVTRPGGTIGLVSWTPEGFIGQMFATMKPFVPAPPPGAQPAPLWGHVDHVLSLFGDSVTDVRARQEALPVAAFASGADFRDYFKAHYGPTIVAYRGLADDPERTAELDMLLAQLGDDQLVDGVMHWEYLLFTATKA